MYEVRSWERRVWNFQGSAAVFSTDDILVNHLFVLGLVSAVVGSQSNSRLSLFLAVWLFLQISYSSLVWLAFGMAGEVVF